MLLLFSLFYLVAPSIASLDYSSNLDQRSRQSQRSCGSQPNRDDDKKFLGPYIVHLEKGHAHEDFEQNVRRSQELHYPFTVSSMKVGTCPQYEIDLPWATKTDSFRYFRFSVAHILCFVLRTMRSCKHLESNFQLFGTCNRLECFYDVPVYILLLLMSLIFLSCRAYMTDPR
jgi:hypothetical protein